MMKNIIRKILIVLSVLMLITGIVLFMFPIVSNWYGVKVANDISDEFDRAIVNMEDGSYKNDPENYSGDKSNTVYYKKDIKRLKKDSIKYNNMLKTKQREKLITEYAYEKPSLNLANYGIYNGVYGYVSAPSINMRLPIYLGADNRNMSYGAAHLTYTSLPIGGERTNCVLAGHTGYVGRIFFDNIRKLKIGDKVSVRNFWSTIDYKVAETKVRKKQQTDDIFLKENKDLLTLITCVSNGKGDFDRYYVICERTKK